MTLMAERVEPPRRGIVAHGAIAAVIGLSLLCIVTDREYWPFSQYEMFSYLVATQPYAESALVGVSQDDGREFSLRPHKYLRPFDWPRQRRALERLLDRPDHDARLSQALADVARRYEQRRSRHDGPALRAVRFYRYEWHRVDPRDSASVNPDRVDRRALLAEWASPAEAP
jgi:hypothetical protein